jgi:class 3 adenylate cyclase
LAEQILTSRAALEGERKQVTVLFCDLVDWTVLASQRDPEEWRMRMTPRGRRGRG